MPLPDASRTRVKICGLTDPDEARRAVELGADWIGLNFHTASKRFVGAERAAAIVAALPDPAAAVALFVDRPVEQILAIVGPLGVGIVQLHGDERPSEVEALRRRGLVVVRAFRLGGADDVEQMMGWWDSAERAGAAPEALLLDSRAAGQAGGTGRAIPEPVLAAAFDRLRGGDRVPAILLAGGLDPSNVGPAVARWRPWMVDVASGVESAPGRKDPALVAAFLASAGG